MVLVLMHMLSWWLTGPLLRNSGYLNYGATTLQNANQDGLVSEERAILKPSTTTLFCSLPLALPRLVMQIGRPVGRATGLNQAKAASAQSPVSLMGQQGGSTA
ncbi:uncharacterized protein LOC116262069 [Nymphaea colorata]|uniref:uncharacterized protein LOC116262069 n=1 Tax=Nymphaea colorata TaxID=210225 RepID=UPI00129DC6A4|nr:uncharacterized protein LOC116262069 [Nymphaea colorata]